jgi:hypothetical protein
MSGIKRREDGTIQVHTTLGANGWVCVSKVGMPFVYVRGEEVIELEAPGNEVAFYSLGDRRITNGTWDSIVERFAVARSDSKDEIGCLWADLVCIDVTSMNESDKEAIERAVEALKRYANTLEQ